MRIGILGDIHSNLEALTVTADRLKEENIDHWVQVGDIVGYGADPIPCIELVRQLGCTICIGNHDAAVVDRLSTDYFNAYARAAIDWTREQLRPSDLEFLRNLPLLVEHDEYTLVHGSLHMPASFGYVLSIVEAVESLRKQRTRMGFVGHSHVPAIYMQRAGAPVEDLDVIYDAEMEGNVDGYDRVLMNVGSVGQPRDEDPRAAYAVYDTVTGDMKIARVAYDIERAQEKIRSAGLPTVLAERLALGV